jgi:hypothetical protein
MEVAVAERPPGRGELLHRSVVELFDDFLATGRTGRHDGVDGGRQGGPRLVQLTDVDGSGAHLDECPRLVADGPLGPAQPLRGARRIGGHVHHQDRRGPQRIHGEAQLLPSELGFLRQEVRPPATDQL